MGQSREGRKMARRGYHKKYWDVERTLLESRDHLFTVHRNITSLSPAQSREIWILMGGRREEEGGGWGVVLI